MRSIRSKGFNPGNFIGGGQITLRGHVIKGEAFKFLTAKQVNAVLAAIWADRESSLRERNHCAIFCGFYIGLRAGEAAILEPRHFDHLRQGIILVPTLKQKKKRKTDLPPEIKVTDVEPEVADYIQQYLQKFGGQPWMFCNGHDCQRHVSAWSLNQMFATYADAAGLPPEFSWHALRHGRGMTVWAATKDMKAVQAALRHKSIAMAEKYSHMDPEKQQERITNLSNRFVTPDMD